MANEQYAFLRRSDVPATPTLQAMIDNDPDFELIVDPETEIHEACGFVPGVISDVESGVEIYFRNSIEVTDSLKGIIGNCDCCLIFRWGGDFCEHSCAAVLSYILAKYANGLIVSQGQTVSKSLSDLRQEAISVYELAHLGL
jgi:hypothetical protein